MKRCFKCGVEKPLVEFYRHPQMADGHLNKCKDCTKSDVRTYWHEHATVLRQTDRTRRRLQKQCNTAISNALRDGRLTKPARCHYCQQEEKLEAHHWSYHRPFDVTWLCVRCHEIADMARRDAEAKLFIDMEQSA